MRGKFLLPILFISSLVIYSCKKDKDFDGLSGIETLTDLKVPEGFTWESSRDVSITINVNDIRFDNAIHVLAVYDTEGKLLSKGAASISNPFATKVYIPYTTKDIYIIKTAPDNSTVSEKVTLTSNDVVVSVGTESFSSAVLSVKNTSSVLSTSPDCTEGCNQSINLSQNYQFITVENGATVCVSGSNKTFSVTFGNGGGTLRICGTALTLQNINKNANNAAIEVIVTSGSTVTFPGLSLDKTNHTFKNYGTATFSSNLASSGLVVNYGSLTVNSDYNINSGNSISHSNEGTLVVKGTMNVNSNTTYNNLGTATCKKLQVNSNATFNNNCKLLVTETLQADNDLNNYGYVLVSGSTQINSNGLVNLYNGAIFITKDLDKISGFIAGNGSTSLAKVTGTINNNLLLDAVQTSNGQKIKGAVQLCYASALPVGLFKDGASQGCAVYIPQSGCTPGNGAAPVTDTDGDGVADNQDDYPNDDTKAFNNFYPSANADAGATVAFEDQWPIKGDYDMNDVVLSYNLKVVTNALNKVVQVNGTYNLRARGGIFQNGCGIEFPISRSLVSDVTGGTLEEGQQKAVIVLFTNMHAEMLYFNTRPDEAVLPSKAYPISFKVTNGPSLAEFGLGEYNPFIWNKTHGRDYEIHLPGKTPTSLADLSLFGTSHDRSNPSKGKYYVTEEGFPWAISVPVKNFAYPIEGKDIVTAYLKLPLWVASGGSNFTDWYSNSADGYRNSANIFK